MFDIGWTEMLVIAIVMIVVVGPKDLPRMLRTFGKTTAKLRSMAGDFQKQFNEALKEAELDDVKKSVDELRSLNPANEIRKQLNPFEKAAADVRAGLRFGAEAVSACQAGRARRPKPAEPLEERRDGYAGSADRCRRRDRRCLRPVPYSRSGRAGCGCSRGVGNESQAGSGKSGQAEGGA